MNKADGVDGQELMRVYGALMWSLGKVVLRKESLRKCLGMQMSGLSGICCFAFSINESRSWWPLRSHVSTLGLGKGPHFQHVKKSTLLKTQHLHLIISRGVKYLELTLLLPGGTVSLATPPSEPSLSSRNRTSLRHPTNIISLPVSDYNDLT